MSRSESTALGTKFRIGHRRLIVKYLKDYSLASTYIRLLIALAVLLTFTLTSVSVKAQCPTTVLASDLRAPTKIIMSKNGNLLVAEQGSGPNTGRISILDPSSGERRTLLDGLPSAINNLGGFPAPSGPSGLAMRGRTLRGAARPLPRH